MRAAIVVALGLLAAVPACGSGEGWGLKKTKELTEAVCACSDKACAKDKLMLVDGYVNDYRNTKTCKENPTECTQVVDQLSAARQCAGKLGAGPFRR